MVSADQLEAILFVAGEDGVTSEVLTGALSCSDDDIEKGFEELQSLCSTTSRPYTPIRIKQTLSLITKSEYSSIIGKIRIQLEKQPLSRAHLEVLSLILYHGPMSKTLIDTFRGVNSGHALRMLGQRGMVEKVGVNHGSTVYAATRDMLSELGVHTASELPQYEEMHKELSGINNEVK